MHTATYAEITADGVRCHLCPHGCLIKEGATGRCRVRSVHGGALQAIGYGRISAAHLDPIEKKPLYHFYPAESVYSIGGWGCNFHCPFCQNWNISQQVDFKKSFTCSASDVVKQAMSSGGIGVAYTYNEPLIGYEFVYDCAVAARENGLKNVLVTNGYVNSEPAAALLPWMDAVNLDIKSMDDTFYRTLCGGSLAPVLRFAQQVVDAGVHLEVTNLLIPGMNNSTQQIEALAAWIANTLNRHVPLHLTAYHPEYTMVLPSTSRVDLQRAFTVAKRHLAHTYTGNLDLPEGRNTFCERCETLLISREERRVQVSLDRDGRCRTCGAATGIIVQGMVS